MINRKDTKQIKVGNVLIGGNNNVVIQSMTNTKTKDVESTVKQIFELEKAGCEIVRVACLDMEDLLDENGKVTAKAMVESAQRHVDILESLDFYDICISLKASSLDLCLEAYEEAARTFKYPLHLGITEAGTAFSGTIKSSIGLGTLLRENIGNTMRVSLSDDPVYEVKVAKEILKDCNLLKNSPTLVSCPTCGRTQIDLIPIAKEMEDFLQTLKSDITVAVMGCAVNGPGEAREADIGIAGGKGEAVLFKKGQVIRKIPQEKIVEELKQEILDMIK